MLFACCVPVRGASRSTLCDLQRNTFIYIPNTLCRLLSEGAPLAMDAMEATYRAEIMQVVDYLVDTEFGFITDRPQAFPPIDFTNDDYPTVLKNAIIDFDEASTHDLRDISHQLSALMCPAVEMRYFTEKPPEKLRDDIRAFDTSTIRSLMLTIKYTGEISMEELGRLCLQYKRVKQIIVHGAGHHAVTPLDMQTTIIFTQEVITDETHCGHIAPYYFRSNIEFFSESLNVNNCLHKKIGIDKRGYIKNCPSMQHAFGHVATCKISDVVNTPAYQQAGKIQKDSLEICRDCEFRYICMDCRAYVADETNPLSKPKKCSYDPYTNTWT